MTTRRPDGCDSGAPELALYILAGGKSRRYGADKARAVHGGQPLICGVARELGAAAVEVTVVAARDGQYDDLGLRTIGDRIPGLGPLGGLLTAVLDRPGEGWLILSACDWSGIRGDWVRLLSGAVRPDSQAVVFRHFDVEPLLALYHTSIEAVARQLIAERRFAMKALLDRVRTVFVPVPDGWDGAVNINRPDAR